MEGREVAFGTGSACPNYLDPRTGQHRPFTEADVIACVRLVEALPETGLLHVDGAAIGPRPARTLPR